MSKSFFTLDDFSFDGKTTLVRIDINAPVDPETGVPKDVTKIERHGKTLLELSEKGAKVVVLSHQGRKGERDFVSLKEHARLANEILGIEVKYVDDVCGEKAVSAIKSLRDGEVLLLENVRFIDEETSVKTIEEQLKTDLVRNLSSVSDIYVNDAFPAAHRTHTSLIAFTEVLPSAAGRVMEAEIKALSSIMDDPERPCVYLLGGAKVDDSFKVAEHALELGIADKVLPVGLLAILMVHAKGVDIGDVNRQLIDSKGGFGYLDKMRKLIDRFNDKIEVPADFAIEENNERVEVTVDSFPVNAPVKDIGEETISKFKEVLLDARTIVVNGPAGVYEDERFSKGTVELFKAVGDSRAFSLAGGGHTLEALKKFGLDSKISYVSTGGKAMLALLAGESLPAIEALKKAYLRSLQSRV